MTPRPHDGPLRWIVPSSSKPGEVHLVELDAYEGNGRCSCPDFTCRHEPVLRETPKLGGVDKTRCKHIRKARNKLLDDLIKRLSTAAKALALLAHASLWSAPSEAFLDALAWTETRNQPQTVADRGAALGPFCFHRAAWIEADHHRQALGLPLHPYERGAFCPVISRSYAHTLLGVYERRLKARGLQPTTERLWLCWTMGWAGAKQIGFRASHAPSYKRRGLARLTQALGGYSPTVP